MTSAQKTARLAGFVYLVHGIGCFLGFLCVPLVRDDVAALARVIARPRLQFNLGIVSDLIAQVCAVFLVILLYRLFSPVDKHLAALLGTLFLVSVPLSLGIPLADVAARFLSGGPGALSSAAGPRLESLVTTLLRLHIHGVFVVEIFWGLWLIPFGLLVLKSRFLPRLLGITLVAGGFAYAAHSLISLLVPAPLPRLYQSLTMLARAAGEFPVIFWLLVMGVRAAPSRNEAALAASPAESLSGFRFDRMPRSPFEE